MTRKNKPLQRLVLMFYNSDFDIVITGRRPIRFESYISDYNWPLDTDSPCSGVKAIAYTNT